MERMMLWSFETGRRERDRRLVNLAHNFPLHKTCSFPLNLTSGIIPEQNSLANKIRVEKKKILDKLFSVNKPASLCNSQVLNKDARVRTGTDLNWNPEK